MPINRQFFFDQTRITLFDGSLKRTSGLKG
jgi:hypothetical protein